MATKRSGLGRGLEDLLKRTDIVEDPGTEGTQGSEGATGPYFTDIEIASIRPNPKQPRSVFDEEALAELSASIKEFGVLQPVVVRPIDGGYELVMGERRLRASELAGLSTIPAIVRETGEDDLLRDALLENIHREQLNPLEEAAAYEQLLNDFGITQEQLSKQIKVSRPQISNTIRLLQLPVPVQRRVAAGVLSAGHARALLALGDPQKMEELAARIVKEGLSVRAVEELVIMEKQTAPKKTRERKPQQRLAGAEQVEEGLSERLDTRVRVQGGKRGRIVIDFAGEEDLARLMDLLLGE
jgi:ParB family chromosome partitioning protein